LEVEVKYLVGTPQALMPQIKKQLAAAAKPGDPRLSLSDKDLLKQIQQGILNAGQSRIENASYKVWIFDAAGKEIKVGYYKDSITESDLLFGC
jgi:hypothetical protein